MGSAKRDLSMEDILKSGIKDIFETYTVEEVYDTYTAASIESMCKIVCGEISGTPRDMVENIAVEFGMVCKHIQNTVSFVVVCNTVTASIAELAGRWVLQIIRGNKVLRTMPISDNLTGNYTVHSLGSGSTKDNVIFMSLLVSKDSADHMLLALELKGDYCITHESLICSGSSVNNFYVYSPSSQGFVRALR